MNNFITFLEQTTKNQHFGSLHLFSSVYKPEDMTWTEIKKKKILWDSNALSHGFQFFWALTCNVLRKLSTMKCFKPNS
jgi:hypothetical protein